MNNLWHKKSISSMRHFCSQVELSNEAFWSLIIVGRNFTYVSGRRFCHYFPPQKCYQVSVNLQLTSWDPTGASQEPTTISFSSVLYLDSCCVLIKKNCLLIWNSRPRAPYTNITTKDLLPAASYDCGSRSQLPSVYKADLVSNNAHCIRPNDYILTKEQDSSTLDKTIATTSVE
jgi:hypothetical protein